jgi:4-hydroxy-tetrahydrodipicolinate reductase
MIKIIITGATGRMGFALSGAAEGDKSVQIGGAVERKGHPAVGTTFFEHGIKIVDDLSLVLDKADVVIDFTLPEATMEYLNVCQKAKKPMVIGTTGLSGDQMAHLKESAKFIPILYSSNMSYGMNLLFKVMAEIAKDLSDYDVEIIEAHHCHKRDAPSGTAKRLAEIIAKARAVDLEDVAVYGRKGNLGARRKEEIGIMSVRAGDIVGDHTIIFAAGSERIELIHRVHGRKAFAQGALKAAKFLVGKDPGLYSMLDIFR